MTLTEARRVLRRAPHVDDASLTAASQVLAVRKFNRPLLWLLVDAGLAVAAAVTNATIGGTGRLLLVASAVANAAMFPVLSQRAAQITATYAVEDAGEVEKVTRLTRSLSTVCGVVLVGGALLAMLLPTLVFSTVCGLVALVSVRSQGRMMVAARRARRVMANTASYPGYAAWCARHDQREAAARDAVAAAG